MRKTRLSFIPLSFARDVELFENEAASRGGEKSLRETRIRNLYYLRLSIMLMKRKRNRGRKFVSALPSLTSSSSSWVVAFSVRWILKFP